MYLDPQHCCFYTTKCSNILRKRENSAVQWVYAVLQTIFLLTKMCTSRLNWVAEYFAPWRAENTFADLSVVQEPPQFRILYLQYIYYIANSVAALKRSFCVTLSNNYYLSRLLIQGKGSGSCPQRPDPDSANNVNAYNTTSYIIYYTYM